MLETDSPPSLPELSFLLEFCALVNDTLSPSSKIGGHPRSVSFIQLVTEPCQFYFVAI